MKIQGLPLGADRTRNTDGTQKTGSSGEYKRLDTKAAQGSVVEKDRLVEAGYVVEPEFEPRVELLESVSKRISGGEYHRPEVTETVARKMVESDIEPETVVREQDVVPPERLEKISDNITSAYYDTNDVQRTIAERIAPVIGLSALFGPVPE